MNVSPCIQNKSFFSVNPVTYSGCESVHAAQWRYTLSSNPDKISYLHLNSHCRYTFTTKVIYFVSTSIPITVIQVTYLYIDGVIQLSSVKQRL